MNFPKPLHGQSLSLRNFSVHHFCSFTKYADTANSATYLGVKNTRTKSKMRGTETLDASQRLFHQRDAFALPTNYGHDETHSKEAFFVRFPTTYKTQWLGMVQEHWCSSVTFQEKFPWTWDVQKIWFNWSSDELRTFWNVFFAFHPSTHPWNFAKVQPRQWDGTWLHRGSSTTGALSSWKIILGAEKWCKLDQSCVILIYHICLCLSTNPEIFSQQKIAWAKVFWDTTAVDILWSMTRHMQMCPTMTHSRYANKDSYFKPKSYLSCTPIPSWANAFQKSCNVVSTNEITGIYLFLTWGVSVLPIFYSIIPPSLIYGCTLKFVYICKHLMKISIKAVLPRGAIVRIASTLQLNPVVICEDIALDRQGLMGILTQT